MKRRPFPRITTDHVFMALFLLILTSPVLGQLPDLFRSSGGAKALLPPLATWQDALAFPRSLALNLSNNFIQRTSLVHFVISAKVNVFAETAEPVPGVIIGADGWLYYTEGQQSYASTPVYTAADLDKMQQNVDGIQAQLKAQGIPLVVVIVPDKQTIYPEYLPAYAKPLGASVALDQIVTYLQQHARTPVLDLRAPLTAAKTQSQIYYRTDSHWTSYGAYVGWQELHKLLATELPGLGSVASLQDFVPNTHTYSGNLARMLTMQDVWTEDTTDWVPPPLASESARSSQPRLMLFGDSFTWGLLPFLNGAFSHVRFDRVIPNCVNFRSVAAEKPAVVIWLMVEVNQQNLWCSPLNTPSP
jgi:alginate O-acetyltransferase complex protein AlgJ